jgi:NADH dehydrogenase [ubiquinone] 1 alpha subcomplex assembly factor 5
MVGRDNPRAAGASRRQHEIEHRASECGERSHLDIVGGGVDRHKREMTEPPTDVPEIFDRAARRLRRGRVSGSGFFAEHMAEDLLDRLDDVKRTFKAALIVGAVPTLIEGLAARGIKATICDPSPRRATWATDEDNLVHPPECLFFANFTGAPTLVSLRQAIASADAEAGTAVARLHPQIDVRSAGDLLTRAGFALPVADIDTVDVAYTNLARLLTDLREAGATNMLKQRYPVSRAWLAAAETAFAALAGADGKTHETLSFITLTGWAPSPDQPKPARRGSGTTSLAQLLDKRFD